MARESSKGVIFPTFCFSGVTIALAYGTGIAIYADVAN
jgi:hypothetical protein